MLTDARLQLAHQIHMPAQAQLDVDALLQYREPVLLQLGGLRAASAGDQVVQRLPAPQRQRVPEVAGGLLQACAGGVTPGLPGGRLERFELLQVELARMYA